MSDIFVIFCLLHMFFLALETPGRQLPQFYDNYYVFQEWKYLSDQNIIYIDEFYSQQGGMVFAKVRAKVNSSTIWLDANTDEFETGPVGNTMCLDQPLDGTMIAKMIGIVPDAAGHMQMSTPEVALGWSKKNQQAKKNLGSSTTRGINSLKWQVCSYIPEMDVTVFQEWDIVDPSMVRLPVVSKNDSSPPVLPLSVMTRVWDNKTHNPVEVGYRIDFTFFDKIKSTESVFQVPTTMLCRQKPSVAQKSLPALPDYFRFKGEQITIANYQSQNPEPAALVFTTEYYEYRLGLFIQDFVQTPNNPTSGNDKSYVRMVNDFNTGVSYTLDLTSGSCSANIVDPNEVDSYAIAGGMVKMRTSTQFFDLDYDQYQYMGVHTMRSIECDAWSAFFDEKQPDHQQNAMYTWYFATSNWMKAHGYINYTQTLPVALELRTGLDYIQFNIYEFDTLDSIDVPDLSECFDPASTTNVEIFFTGRYDQIVTPDVVGFSRMFMVYVMSVTSVNSPLRIANVDSAPSGANEFVVRFKLLDTSAKNIKGDVQNAQAPVPNNKIYQELTTWVQGGKFVVQGTSVPVVASRIDIATSASKFSSSSSSSASSSASTGSGGSSSGYSSGAMAGIGIGMLVLGLILGVVAVFLFKKFRGAGPGIDNVGLNKLEQERDA